MSMDKSRREFLKQAGLTGLLFAGSSGVPAAATGSFLERGRVPGGNKPIREERSVIGPYGEWAASLLEKTLPSHSLRRRAWPDLDTWRSEARQKMLDRLVVPEMGELPDVQVLREGRYDGVQIEELRWQLPYGRPTEALLLKPAGTTGRLPGVLAFYEHGLQKYFGTRKIVRTSPRMHPVLEEHYREYYEGISWANELAKRGYVVLVADVFPFGSRRVELEDVPEYLREGFRFRNPSEPTPEEIGRYNRWAAGHEHIMAKSLFSAGITWPGVFFGEDRTALDILCSREDVDAERIGCGGLSGGGLRTVVTGGLDPRIKCAVCVAFMTTWRDLVIHNSYTHTWMAFIPRLPGELDFPEILGLRAPMPTLVLNAEDDPLFTLSEMRRADQIMQEVYRLAGASSHYRASFHPGPHQFGRAMQKEAFEWFDQWLK